MICSAVSCEQKRQFFTNGDAGANNSGDGDGAGANSNDDDGGGTNSAPR
jgi:hypothetical protein